MIPHITYGDSAMGGARYDLFGVKDSDPLKRVAFTDTRNLASKHPLIGAAIMDSEIIHARAEMGSRVKQPIMRVAFSLPHGEHLSPEEWGEAIDFIANHKRIGLGEHQANIVGHKDTDHDHVHVEWNRVKDGKTWRKEHDWRRFREACTEYEKIKGLRIVTHEKEDTRRRAPSHVERMIEKRTGKTARKKFSTNEVAEIGEDVREDLHAATSWDDLQDRMANHGLEMQGKGAGLILTNGAAELKLSQVDRNIRRARPSRELKRDTSEVIYLEERFGETWEDYAGRTGEERAGVKSKKAPKIKAKRAQKIKKAKWQEREKPQQTAKKATTEREEKPPALDAETSKDPQSGQNERLEQEKIAPAATKPKKERVQQPKAPEKRGEGLEMETMPQQQMTDEQIEHWRGAIGYGLVRAGGWKQLEFLASTHGLKLSRGYALHDTSAHFSMAKIDPSLRRDKLEDRFGKWSAYRQGKALDARAEKRAAEIEAEMQARRARDRDSDMER